VVAGNLRRPDAPLPKQVTCTGIGFKVVVTRLANGTDREGIPREFNQPEQIAGISVGGPDQDLLGPDPVVADIHIDCPGIEFKIVGTRFADGPDRQGIPRECNQPEKIPDAVVLAAGLKAQKRLDQLNIRYISCGAV
jgi:hypothetical protein